MKLVGALPIPEQVTATGVSVVRACEAIQTDNFALCRVATRTADCNTLFPSRLGATPPDSPLARRGCLSPALGSGILHITLFWGVAVGSSARAAALATFLSLL